MSILFRSHRAEPDVFREIVVYVLHPQPEGFVIQHIRIGLQPPLRVRLQISVDELVDLIADVFVVFPNQAILQLPEGEDAPVQKDEGLLCCCRLLIQEIV